MNNLTGQKFGRLTVICDSQKRKWGQIFWICLCNCGNLIRVNGAGMKRGDNKSCGCLRREYSSQLGIGKQTYIRRGGRPKTHGATYTRLYRIWGYIKERCNNPRHSNYKYYGNRGILVCKEWLNSFVAFRDWATMNGYQDNLTIDRIDNNGNYESSNCQWLTRSENAKKAGD